MPDRYPQRRFTPPPGSTEVILVRHGASAAAVPGEPFDLLDGHADPPRPPGVPPGAPAPPPPGGRGEPFALLDGHADPPLAPEGVEQAEAVARRLAGEPLAALFVTPLRRTQETAAPLAEATGLEPAVVPELREVMLGDWEGGKLRIHAAQGD